MVGRLTRKLGKDADGVFINIDGRDFIPAMYGGDRPDVAKAFHNDDYRFSGFSAQFATSALSKGYHSLILKIITKDKRSLLPTEADYPGNSIGELAQKELFL